jgi:hypothetical protein
MQSNDTQPLTPDQVPDEETLTSEEEQLEKAKQNWQSLLEVFKSAPQPHVHGPFTFLMNQNHNALRGCTACGRTWVGSMAGTEDSIRWHEVQEPPEDKEE